ncbi:hypothetical protein BS47DRAFT_1367663 [Hydnum rufescens UP504]|uniref:Uncharacterized protein n=1 Tax=Hydnum rufescens UP504 TaxID=1448309 RepID=A0A9P6AI71_9AGAM|nr:hypothetical protein BS47DRAFT_1367663 [Hydnum rufescens UP504]
MLPWPRRCRCLLSLSCKLLTPKQGDCAEGLGMILLDSTLQSILTMVSLLNSEVFGAVYQWLQRFDYSGAIGDLSKREGEASREGKEGYKTWAKSISIQLEEIEAKVNQKMFLGSSRVSILKKLGKDLSEKGFIEKRNSQS